MATDEQNLQYILTRLIQGEGMLRSGRPVQDVANYFDVSTETYNRWRERYRTLIERRMEPPEGSAEESVPCEVPRLQLPRSLPFVDAVFRITEDRGTVDEAATILLDAQRRHRLSILPSSIPWEVVEPQLKTLMEKATDGPSSTVNAARPDSEAAEVCTLAPPRPTQPPPDLIPWDTTTVEPSLFGFMDETAFMMAGEHFCNDYNIHIWGVRTGLPGSWRYWGEVMATWANRLPWMTPDPMTHTWIYLDFYMILFGLPGMDADWGKWYGAEREVLEAACRRWP